MILLVKDLKYPFKIGAENYKKRWRRKEFKLKGKVLCHCLISLCSAAAKSTGVTVEKLVSLQAYFCY